MKHSARLFQLLDEYARSRHNCFLAEFFQDDNTHEQILCFRPTGVSREDANRFACRYVRIKSPEMRVLGALQILPVEVTKMLSRELTALIAELKEIDD